VQQAEKKEDSQRVEQNLLVMHNDLTALSLTGFKASEIDLLSAVCHEMQNQSTNRITITYGRLRELAHFESTSIDRLHDDLVAMDRKLSALEFRRNSDTEYVRFTLFPTFIASNEKQAVTVAVNSDFVYLLNRLTGNFTALELMESASLGSKYSKQIYKQLRRFRSTGKWIVDISDFRAYLDIPKNYRMSEVDCNVINIAIDELSPYFQGLTVSKETRHKLHRRGRPAIDTLVWSWIPQTQKKVVATNTDEQQQSRSKCKKVVSRTNFICPECSEKAIIELKAKDDHIFWKCENCKKTFSTIAEIKGISETPSRTLKIDDTETKSEEVYIPGIEEINQLKNSLSMKSAKTANDTTDEQKNEEHTSKKTVVNPVPVKHDITQCANPMARALDTIIWPYVERNALDYPIIPKGELRKVLGMDKTYSDEDLLTMLKEALSVLVDLGRYDDIQIQVGKYKNGHLKDVLLMPFVKTSQA
jgi:plasmid replication initiation protein